ncbi:EAL domain-containing protein [Dongia sp.]|uniref:EAL domain-containing protein n=1 Tax=Dongia sp. TaxID=1977262 RepID=UPI0035B24C9E
MSGRLKLKLLVFVIAFLFGLAAPLIGSNNPNMLLAFGAMIGIIMGLVAAMAVERPEPLAKQFTRAIEEGGLSMAYQPIVTLDANHTIIGAEPLLRWTTEVGDAISPSDFLPMAKALNLTATLNQRVLDMVLADLKPALTGERELCVTLNLEPDEFTDVAKRNALAAKVAAAGIPPHRLAIEVNEIDAADRHIRPAIWDMKQRGFRISIDDFGIGGGDSEYLSSLNPDLVKLNRRFVSLSANGGPVSGLVAELVRLAKKCNGRIVMVGIENADIARRASALGADLGQGFHWHKPMPARDFLELLRG